MLDVWVGAPRRFSGVAFALLLAGLVTAPTAVAGPWEVGGLDPDRAYKLKLEFGLKRHALGKTWERPTVGFAAPLTHRLSWEVVAGYGLAEDADGREYGGMRDLKATLKWLLVDGAGSGPSVMFEPNLSLPTGADRPGVGGGPTTLKLPVRIGQRFGDVIWTGETVYTRAFGRGHDDLIGYGVLMEYVVSPHWLVGMDLFNDQPVNDSRRYHLRSHVAAKWKQGNGFEVHGLVGRSLANRRGAATTSYKLAFEYKF